jgi:chemotaxis protein MotB
MGRRGKGGHGGGHHGGAWKVAYADFVTSMMALFMILWLVNMVPKEKRPALASYFKTGGMWRDQGSSLLDMNPDTREDTIVARDPVVPPAVMLLVPEPVASLQAVEDTVRESVLEGELWPFRDQIQIRQTAEGLEISLLDPRNRTNFAPGSSTPTAEMRALLRQVARALQGYGNAVSIGGHTDAHPVTGKGIYTNWELSTDRANQARALLVGFGVREARIASVRGFATTRPLDPEHPFADANRRITVVLLKGEEPT